MTTTTYTVSGMTCGCCARKVTDAVGEVGGVTSVDVDEATGLVTVQSNAPVDPAAVRTAVKEAGYQVANA